MNRQSHSCNPDRCTSLSLEDSIQIPSARSLQHISAHVDNECLNTPDPRRKIRKNVNLPQQNTLRCAVRSCRPTSDARRDNIRELVNSLRVPRDDPPLEISSMPIINQRCLNRYRSFQLPFLMFVVLKCPPKATSPKLTGRLKYLPTVFKLRLGPSRQHNYSRLICAASCHKRSALPPWVGRVFES